MTESKKNDKKKSFSSGVIGATKILVAALAITLAPTLIYDKKPDIPYVPVYHPIPEEPVPEKETTPNNTPPEIAAYIKENGPIAETKYRNVGSKEPNNHSALIMICGDGVFTISHKNAHISVLHDGVNVKVAAPLSDVSTAEYNVRMGGESRDTGGDHSILAMSYTKRDGEKVAIPGSAVNSLSPKKKKTFKNAVKTLIGAVREKFPSDVPAERVLFCDPAISGVAVLEDKKVKNSFFKLAGEVQSNAGGLSRAAWVIYNRNLKARKAAAAALEKQEAAEAKAKEEIGQKIAPIINTSHGR